LKSTRRRSKRVFVWLKVLEARRNIVIHRRRIMWQVRSNWRHLLLFYSILRWMLLIVQLWGMNDAWIVRTRWKFPRANISLIMLILLPQPYIISLWQVVAAYRVTPKVLWLLMSVNIRLNDSFHLWWRGILLLLLLSHSNISLIIHFILF